MLTEVLVAALALVSLYAIWAQGRTNQRVLDQNRRLTEALIGVSSEQGAALATEMERSAREPQPNGKHNRQEDGVVLIRPAR